MLRIRDITDKSELLRLDEAASQLFCPGDKEVRVTQAMINMQAAISGDNQWIHIDPARAAIESPFGRTSESAIGKTIAHGNLVFTLRDAVLPLSDVIQVDDAKYVIHRKGKYSFGKPVCADRTIRGFWRLPKVPIRRKNVLPVDFDYRICIVEEDDNIALEGSVRVIFVL